MGDNQDLFDSPFGLTLALIERRNAKKAMQQIIRNNILNQGIVHYQKTQIENFFDDTKPVGNIILSGGDEIVRFRALVRGMGCAYSQGYIPVVLHASNFGLENHLVSELGNVPPLTPANLK